MNNRRSPFEGRTLIPRAVTRPRADRHRIVILLLAVGALAFWLRLAQAAEATPATDSQRITRMMKAQFDRPGQPWSVEPVVIEGPFAVAGWIQGDTGGRALLQRAGNQWEIVLCSGDGLLQATTLTGAGMSGEAASRLLTRVRESEERLAPAQRAKFASFAGLVRMRPAGEIAIAPGATIQIEPSGLHMMLVGLKGSVIEGRSLPLTLLFRSAGAVTVQVAIRPLVDTPMPAGH